MEILLIITQIENWVSNYLSGTVISYFATSLDSIQLIFSLQMVEFEKFQASTSTECIDRGMFEEEQCIGAVWLEGCKVAAIGIKVSKWVTMHGFALNVCPDLSGFERIIPCGLVDRSVGSMAEFVLDINPDLVRQQIVKVFSEIFEVEILESQNKV